MKYIAFSGGVESSAMCVLFGGKADAVFTDTGFEFPEIYERLDLVEKTVREFHGNQFKVIRIKNEKENSLVEYIQKSKFYPSYGQRFCTRMFKIEPMDDFLSDGDEIMIGLNADEGHRAGNHGIKQGVKYSYPLLENGITRKMCIEILNSVGLNTNFPVYMRRGGCIGCYYKSKPEIIAMYKLNRKAYNYIQEIEESIQDKRGKEFHILGNIGMTLKKFAEKIESEPELFGPEVYSVVNDSTPCGVFCNR